MSLQSSRCPLVVLILAFSVLVAMSTGTVRASESFDFRQYVQDALRGDVGTHLSMRDGTGGGDARLDQLRARLGAEPTEPLPATGSEMLDEAIATYRDYWRRALRGEIEPDAWRSAIEMDVTRILEGLAETDGFADWVAEDGTGDPQVHDCTFVGTLVVRRVFDVLEAADLRSQALVRKRGAVIHILRKEQ